MIKNKTAALRSELYAQMVFSRADLLQGGASGHEITRAVNAGLLLRLRRDHYAHPDIDPDVAEAVRVGGRLACLTLLQKLGVFVLNAACLHIFIAPDTSRIRAPRLRSTVLHWSRRSQRGKSRHVVSLRDAVLQATLCQDPRAAIATLDSLLHLRLATRTQLIGLFELLPVRLQPILSLVDGTAESGPETYMRLILRTLGVRFETQVVIPGVGRVDFVIEGWLIIECDSKEFHEGWNKQVEDRRRDIAAAGLGYTTIRPIASDILYDSPSVRQKISDVLEAFAQPARRRRVA
ncbi:endonuclease domain-containing protein [Microbacterium sp. A204]|uniref:endonuclease domain-containing protein n=1 Tax=Microbacterium sp. A204 TaxID=3457321 RepID=UPI003FD3564F